MFDWTQRGEASAHRFRGYYDAGEHSTTHCDQCNRVIRFCYSLRDQNMKSFVIGTCCFQNYTGKTLVQLEAARTLQACRRAAVEHDIKLHAPDELVREYQTQWRFKRRWARLLLRQYRKAHGKWLPKPLYDLQNTVQSRPRVYKRQTYALAWYIEQINKLDAQTEEAKTVSI
jgi:hypothetical protein